MDLEIYGSNAHYYAAAFDWPVEHHVAGIARIAGRSHGRVLEPMCGSARLLRAFASAGFDTVGVDLSAPLLDIARQDFSARGLSGEFLEADVADFRIRKACDLAVCPVNSLAHLQSATEMERHLRAVSRSLYHGGQYWVQLDVKDAKRVDLPEKWTFEHCGETLEFEWSVVEVGVGFETHQDRIFNDGRVIFQERHRMKRWSYEDWIAVLAKSRFKLNAAYDGNSFEQLDVGDSLGQLRVFWQQLTKLQ